MPYMKFNTKIILILFLLVSVITQSANAKSITAIALFNNKAMLSVDDSKAKIIKVGATYKGVKLLSSNTREAIVEVAGVKKTLRLNSTAKVSSDLRGRGGNSQSSSVTMYVDDLGFFRSSGLVNGRSTSFLVDTGANLVVFNSRQANNLNIKYLDGRKGYASTASGRAVMYSVVLKEMSVGGIRLENIEAGVIEGGFPEIPLLGMTFLQKLDMNRSGGTMVLRKR